MAQISRRSFVRGAALASAMAIGGASLTGCGSGSSNTAASNLSAETDLQKMTWDQVLAEAKGETVTFLAWGSGGADAFVQKWWEHLAEDMKSKYDITLTYAEETTAEDEKLVTDAQNKSDATYDLYWGLGSAFSNLRKADGLWTEEWLGKLPNSKYLDMDNEFNTFDGTTAINDAESGFQGLNPSLVYSTDAWSHELKYSESKGSVKGLFHNFTELAAWVKLNPGKFTYMDLTGKGAFHGLSFAKEVLAELTDDGKGGWKAVYDEKDDTATRRKKINDNISSWYKWATSSEASEEKFVEKAAYLWAYLNEISPNLLQGDNGTLYVPTAPEMMSYVKSGALACTFTTCTQVSNRVEASPDSYMANPAIYMLDTTVASWDYVIITSNSKHKAAALVVANEMLDPEQQLTAFTTTGNGYNVAYSKLDSSVQKKFDEAIKGMGTLTSTSDAIANNAYTDQFGPVAKWIASGWSTKVANA